MPMRDVTLHIDAQDEGSSVAEMRLRLVGAPWGMWQPYVANAALRLADTTNRQTAEIQLRDRAGNESALLRASVELDLTNEQPSSTNYTVACSVVAHGGGQSSSTSYTVRSTIGQEVASGAASSASYTVNSGLWGCATVTSGVPTSVGLTLARSNNSAIVIVLLMSSVILAYSSRALLHRR